ncbi:hypothetical protein Dcae01_02096 [Deinococcus caeni]|uniref:Uncharacterized protein n=1 Tax=Deinococcus caeni TaxID=569127 RepID=A0ABP9UFP7_9DEIO
MRPGNFKPLPRGPSFWSLFSRLWNLLVVGAGGAAVDLERQGAHGFAGVEVDGAVAEGGEQQRGGLAGHAGQCQHHAGHDAAGGGGQDNAQRDQPLGQAQRQSGLADGLRHELQDFLGGADHDGHHQETQGQRAGEAREAELQHDQAVHDQTHHDGGNAGQHVADHANGRHQRVAGVLGEEDPAGHADEHADHAGHGEHLDAAQDGVGEAAARLAFRGGDLGEEVHVDGAQALADQVEEDQDQGRDDQQGGEQDQAAHQHVLEPAGGAQGAPGGRGGADGSGHWIPLGVRRAMIRRAT